MIDFQEASDFEKSKDNLGEDAADQPPEYVIDEAQTSKVDADRVVQLPQATDLCDLECEEIPLAWLVSPGQECQLEMFEKASLVYVNGFFWGLPSVRAILAQERFKNKCFHYIEPDNYIIFNATFEGFMKTVLDSSKPEMVILAHIDRVTNESFLVTFNSIPLDKLLGWLEKLHCIGVQLIIIDDEGKRFTFPDEVGALAGGFACPWQQINTQHWAQILYWNAEQSAEMLTYLQRRCQQSKHEARLARSVRQFSDENVRSLQLDCDVQELLEEFEVKCPAINQGDKAKIQGLLENWDHQLILHFLSCYAVMARFGSVDYYSFIHLTEELLPNEPIDIPMVIEDIQERSEAGALLLEKRTTRYEKKMLLDVWSTKLDELLWCCDFEIEMSDNDSPFPRMMLTPSGWQDENFNDLYRLRPQHLSQIFLRAKSCVWNRHERDRAQGLESILKASIVSTSSKISTGQLERTVMEWVSHFPKHIPPKDFSFIVNTFYHIIKILLDSTRHLRDGDVITKVLSRVCERSRSSSLCALQVILQFFEHHDYRGDPRLEKMLVTVLETYSRVQGSQDELLKNEDFLGYFREWSKPLLKHSIIARLRIFRALLEVSQSKTGAVNYQSLHSLWFYVLWHDFVVKSQNQSESFLEVFSSKPEVLFHLLCLLTRFDPKNLLPRKDGMGSSLEVPLFYFMIHDCDNDAISSVLFKTCTVKFAVAIDDFYENSRESDGKAAYSARLFRNAIVFEWIACALPYQALDSDQSQQMEKMLDAVNVAYETEESIQKLLFDWKLFVRLLSIACREFEEAASREMLDSGAGLRDNTQLREEVSRITRHFKSKINRLRTMHKYISLAPKAAHNTIVDETPFESTQSV